MTIGSRGAAGPIIGGPFPTNANQVVFFDDFIGPPDYSTTADAATWELKDAAGTASVAGKDAEHGGVVTVTSGSTAGNDGFMQVNGTCFTMADGRAGALHGRLKIEDVDQDEFYFGLHTTVADLVAFTSTNGFGFKADADGNLDAISGNGSTVNVTDTGIDIEDDTFFDVSVVVNGNSSLIFYVNGTKVATHSSNLPTAALTPSFGVETNDTGADYIAVDYIGVAFER